MHVCSVGRLKQLAAIAYYFLFECHPIVIKQTSHYISSRFNDVIYVYSYYDRNHDDRGAKTFAQQRLIADQKQRGFYRHV